MTETFIPARGLAGPHAQTIGGRLLRSRSGVSFYRERVDLPDGDFLDLDWPRMAGASGLLDAGGPSVPLGAPGRPLVVALHGLEGTARSNYMLEMYRALHREGLAAVGVNFRSCSGEPNRLARFYHSGDTQDLRTVLARLRGRFPGRSLGAVGFSLGGNVLLKYLAEEGDASGLVVAGAISVPYDLASGATFIERGGSRIYLAYLLRKLRRKVRAKRRLLAAAGVNVDRLLRARTFWEFDEWGTAPLHGFASARDYYARASAGPLVDRITTPTMTVHADDDPFLPPEAVPRPALEDNPAIVPQLVERGGHVGFVGGRLVAPRFWAEARVARFLSERLVTS